MQVQNILNKIVLRMFIYAGPLALADLGVKV